MFVTAFVAISSRSALASTPQKLFQYAGGLLGVAVLASMAPKPRDRRNAVIALPLPPGSEPPREREVVEEVADTECKASMSKVIGSGLTTTTVRQEATFTIEAHNGRGERKEEGGDAFFVSIRGCGVRLRAKVIDNQDGSYTVKYKTQTSGVYAIAISLLGESLPGSPFLCHARTPTAEASQCIVRGDALHLAIARTTHSFEVSFRDAEGVCAHAEELDVYVENAEEQPEPEGGEAGAPAPAASDGNAAATSKQSQKATATALSSAAAAAAEQHRATSRSRLGTMTAHERNFWLKRIPRLQTKGSTLRHDNAPRECVITSRNPLIARSSHALDSDRTCQLLPGRRIYLLDMKHEESGVTRALAAVDQDDVDDDVKRAEDSWRETYNVRPPWSEELSTMSNVSRASSPRSPRRAPVGWVTISKDGRELVTPNCQLTAGDRQLHKQAWARRLAVDRSMEQRGGEASKSRGTQERSSAEIKRSKLLAAATSGKNTAGIYQNELKSDPTGVGFAFGGVEPGRLHAHGKVVETHKVFYSIGLVGTYRMHVGLRQQAMPLPGSPFKLKVVPGPAIASSTSVPTSVTFPLRGRAGLEESDGCHLVLPVCDRMGNLCIEGGAKVVCNCASDKIVAQTKDNEDGTYELVWQSQASGSFEVTVSIDGEQIRSSPFMISVMSDTADLSKTRASGPGLSKTVVGTPSTIQVQLHDQYDNATVMPSLKFGMTIVATLKDLEKSKDKEEKKLKEKQIKEKWQRAPSDPFEGVWLETAYEMKYQPTIAGEMDLFLWCEQAGKPRELVPDSPFRVDCNAGPAHPPRCRLDGFEIEEVLMERGAAKKGAAEQKAVKGGTQKDSNVVCEAKEAGSTISAGEQMVFRPNLCDAYGNPAAAAEGALSVVVIAPTGEHVLETVEQTKQGLISYEARYEPKTEADYFFEVKYSGEHISGSPMAVKVQAGIPDVNKSHIILPEGPLYACQGGQTFSYDLTLEAVDRLGNKCTVGGAFVTARYGGSNLPQGQDSNVEVEDLNNGSYKMELSLKSSAEVKLIIMVAKHASAAKGESTGSGVVTEFAPINLAFLNRQAELMKAEKEAKRQGQASGITADDTAEAAKSKEPKKEKNAKLKGAAKEILSAFGNPDDRRDKQVFGSAEAVLSVAADAFSDAGVRARAKREVCSPSASPSASFMGSIEPIVQEDPKEPEAAIDVT